MRTEADVTVARPPEEVFDYLARAERMPEYVDDFGKIAAASPEAPARGSRYEYEMKRGGVTGTFDWTEFERPSKLAWAGPPVKSGPGTMAPSGWWELTPDGEGTHVKLVMTPTPTGIFKVMAPLMKVGMRKGNRRALDKLKRRLEG